MFSACSNGNFSGTIGGYWRGRLNARFNGLLNARSNAIQNVSFSSFLTVSTLFLLSLAVGLAHGSKSGLKCSYFGSFIVALIQPPKRPLKLPLIFCFDTEYFKILFFLFFFNNSLFCMYSKTHGTMKNNIWFLLIFFSSPLKLPYDLL